MLLQEEYFNRHKIDVPLVRYEYNVNVVLRNPAYQWLIFSGNYQDVKHHPGYFKFYYIKPRHNGVSDKLFDSLADYDKCYWDQYEQLILRWMNSLRTPKNYGFKAVTDIKELTLVAWEIFLYTHDRLIANNAFYGHSFYDLIEQSTNPSVDISTRLLAYQKAIKRLEESSSAYQSYKNNILCYTRNYSFWLANLINK